MPTLSSCAFKLPYGWLQIGIVCPSFLPIPRVSFRVHHFHPIANLRQNIIGLTTFTFAFQSNQIKQMEDVKISKKSKVGILPFVAEFEEFAALAESIFKNAERRGDLDKAYLKLIRGVFTNGRVYFMIRNSGLFCMTKPTFHYGEEMGRFVNINIGLTFICWVCI